MFGKLFIMLIASNLTKAVMGGQGANAAPDPTYQNADTKARNLQAWETLRVFHHALVKAVQDDDPNVGWPAPPGLDLAGLLGKAAGGLPGILSNPLVAQMLPKILAGVGGAATTAPATPPGTPAQPLS